MVKQVITKYSSLQYFIEQFFIILPVLWNEWNYRIVYSYQKVKVVSHNINSPGAQYTELLSSYAWNFFLTELTLAEKDIYKFVPIVGNAGIFQALTSQGRIEVSHFQCLCCFFQSMKLPCHHIFCHAKMLGCLCMTKIFVTPDVPTTTVQPTKGW